MIVDVEITCPRSLPFGMRYKSKTSMLERGYRIYPESWGYDPVSQVSELIRMGGATEPTTISNCADTTGVFNTDSDSSSDDTGND